MLWRDSSATRRSASIAGAPSPPCDACSPCCTASRSRTPSPTDLPSPPPSCAGCMSQPIIDPAQERALIARARGGDEDAFAQLVTEHSGRVYGALRGFGLNPQEADEVAQEVFVRAWRGLARF